MPVTRDANALSSVHFALASAATLTSLTVDAGNCLIVQLALQSRASDVRVFWDADEPQPQELSCIGCRGASPLSSVYHPVAYLFGFVAAGGPPLTTGRKTLLASWTNVASGAINAVSYRGVDHTGGIGSFYNFVPRYDEGRPGAYSGVFVSGAPEDMLIDCATAEVSLSPPSQALLALDTGGSVPLGATEAAGADSVFSNKTFLRSRTGRISQSRSGPADQDDGFGKLARRRVDLVDARASGADQTPSIRRDAHTAAKTCPFDSFQHDSGSLRLVERLYELGKHRSRLHLR